MKMTIYVIFELLFIFFIFLFILYSIGKFEILAKLLSYDFLFILFYDFFIFLFSFPKFSNQQLNNYEIKPGKCLKINVSVPNLRLFVGNIPKSKGKEEILDEFGKLTGK